MLLSELVQVAATVAATRSRLSKTEALAGVLARLAPDETRAAVGLLTGTPRQGRLGVGWRGIAGLKTARLAEGAALAPILNGVVDRIETLVAAAEREAAAQPAALKDRFAKRLAELLGDAVPADRVVQEAAAQAVKADVREELDRLASHVAAARGLLAGEGASGRRLDFLSQEFMRESNTLCSKSALTALTAIGLELKAVIEQFREQVQNVE